MNRNDRRVAIAAVCVGVLALVGIWIGGENPPTSTQGDEETRDSSYSRESRLSRGSRENRDSSNSYYAVESRSVERFPFDPNTADSTQLLRLGLQPWQVRNIYKYRAKGGIYRQKEDFAKLYGLTVKQYRELEPYIRISSDYQPAAILVETRGSRDSRYSSDTRDSSLRYPVKIKENEHVVLNTADTTQLRTVPGIGTYYAKEIVRHGQWLGGYVSVDQLDEIEGFPQESKKYFVIRGASPKKLNVNKLNLQQLRKHPYINYYQAKTILDYRRLHGKITSLDDLRLSKDFPPEAIRRLEPYVEF
ncbi:MAG: helix-hairpin-helix domain-containing protein [Prevotella sp.]|nr:helix-hairpin-helix domain-containing protein [Prevotella sp.]